MTNEQKVRLVELLNMMTNEVFTFGELDLATASEMCDLLQHLPTDQGSMDLTDYVPAPTD